MQYTPRPRVLYVDDDDDSRQMLITLLRLADIDVTTVGNGLEAMALIKTERFDLYLLDGWLPGLDGFELCRMMRSSDRQIPILFFSGAGYLADTNRGIAAGADAYIIKPDIEGLLRTITRMVDPICRQNCQKTIGVEQEAHGPIYRDLEFV